MSALIKKRLPSYVEHFANDGTSLELALQKSFSETNKQVNESDIDTRFSGSTCVSTTVSGKRLVVANVGDSRAILVRSSGQ